MTRLNLLTNSGFETIVGTADDGTSDTFTGWTANAVNDGTGDKIEATATAQAGSYAVKITTTTAMPYLTQDFTVTPGYTYRVALYGQGTGSLQGTYKVLDGTTSVLATQGAGTQASYAQVMAYFRAPTAATALTLYLQGVADLAAGGTIYFDAVTVEKLNLFLPQAGDLNWEATWNRDLDLLDALLGAYAWLTGSMIWDPGSVANDAMTSTRVYVSGAVMGDPVTVGFSTAVPAGALLVGAVTATDIVTVTLYNLTGSPLDLTSGTLTVNVYGRGAHRPVELIRNGSFEIFTGTVDDGTSDAVTNWDIVNDGARNKFEATATAQAGSYGVKITHAIKAPTPYAYQTAIPVTAGTAYQLTFYTRGDGTRQGQYSIYDETNAGYIVAATNTGVTGTAYTAVTSVFTAPVGCASVKIAVWGSAVAGVVYFDAVSLKEV